MSTAADQPPRRWQFSLKSALTGIFLLCVLLAYARFPLPIPLLPTALVAIWHGSKRGAPAAILAASCACGLAAVVVSVINQASEGLVGWRFAPVLDVGFAGIYLVAGVVFGFLIGLFVGLPIVIARHHWTRRLERGRRDAGRPARLDEGP